MGEDCAVCSDHLPEEHAVCSLNGCKLHFQCAGIQESTWRKANKSSWKCPDCRKGKTNDVIPVTAEEQRNFMTLVLGKLEVLDELKTLKPMVKDLEVSVSYLSEKYDEVMETFRENKKKINELETKVNKLNSDSLDKDKTISELQMKIRDADQYARNRNIEISGVNEVEGEDLRIIMKKIAAALKIKHEDGDIDVIHRVPSKGKDKNSKIIAQFYTRSKRDEWMQKKRVAPVYASDIIDTHSTHRVYLNTHLCQQWKQLLWLAKQEGRPRGYKLIWFWNGKILAKKDVTDQNVIRIVSEQDLDRLV
ncbi:Spindle pole body component 110 [Frankliniella fusca]|uniref:Spindle pole body component 110 n=1 Tax=Frankliniella fusca TaxID=407009 RepID=A0AAE1HDP4_9NEOP|nr:Spindle pole body component 110 [Frankliniella fusca]